MRKMFLIGLMVGLMIAALPAGAEDGAVLAPVSGVGRVHRCADTTTGGATQSITGWRLTPTPGKAFELKSTGDNAILNDFDIDFYLGYTPCAQGAVTALPAHENVDGNEAGIVPAGTTYAVVRLHRGAAGNFSYSESNLISPAVKGQGTPTIVVIDTGLFAGHTEFNYCGCGVTTTGTDADPGDQIAAWWDFSRERPDGTRQPSAQLPGLGQTWDTRWAHPYDRHGHGTATASLAAGLNKGSQKDLSFAPGFKLGVAKVGEGPGTISGNLGEAVKWAVDSVGADVITMSIGATAPFPKVLMGSFYEHARYARERGVMVVVSNGNGFGNTSLVPGDPGWAKGYGNSSSVLSVGAGGHLPYSGLQTGYQATTDGEVSAKYTGVGVAALPSSDPQGCQSDCYAAVPGTSFSAPIVAGMAARLISEIKPRKNATPDYIETLLKYSARDTQAPPNFEGYGRLDYHQLTNVALPHARKHSLPSRPSPDLNAFYVEQVGGTLKRTWTETLDVRLPESISLIYQIPTGASTQSTAGAIGNSLPTGLSEGESYKFTAIAGETVTLATRYAPSDWEGLHDFDVYIHQGTDPIVPGAFSAVTQVTRSVNGFGIDEELTFTAPTSGTYTMLVFGWMILEPQGFTVESNRTDLRYAGETYYAHNYGV